MAVTPGGSFVWQPAEKRDAIDVELAATQDYVRNPQVSVDGLAIDATDYAVTTGLVKGKVAATEFGTPGPVLFKSKGWMLVLKPLSKGVHTLTISDELGRLDDKLQPVIENGKQPWDLSTVTFTLYVGVPVPAGAPTTTR